MTAQQYSRVDRLYILAKVCRQNNVTPNSPSYMGLIIRVATSKLSMSTDSAKEYASDLKSAYNADQWQGILCTETETETITENTAKVDANTPTLNVLKTFNLTKPTEPIKHISPKLSAEEADYAPRTIAQRLIKIANHNNFNAVGRITLQQARDELDDKSLQLRDIKDLINQYAPTIDTETRPGNILLLYVKGRNTTAAYRKARPIIPQLEDATQ